MPFYLSGVNSGKRRNSAISGPKIYPRYLRSAEMLILTANFTAMPAVKGSRTITEHNFENNYMPMP
jgi:hypothetical protein